MKEPLPLFHATMAMPIEGMPTGWSARVVLLSRPDGAIEPLGSLVEYMKAYPTRSRTWQDNVARGVGLLWDFCRSRSSTFAIEEAGGRAAQRRVYREFALALLTGTMRDGYDESGLFWPPVPRDRVQVLLRAVEDFAAWCHSERDGADRISALAAEPRGALDFTDLLVFGRMRQVSMLAHIQQPRQVRRGSIVDLGRSASGPSVEPVKFFPPEHVERLLWEGHVRPGRRHETNPFLRYNVRDQMIALLDGWGGLRRSEGFHLWVSDVVEDPTKPGHALVVLNHPDQAAVQYFDPLTKREVTGTRGAALEALYRLRPRNEVKRGRYHAGWKGMDLDRNAQATVVWLDQNASALFWVLYLGYIRFVRRPIMEMRAARGGRDHPFLFVSEGEAGHGDGPAKPGDPYSIQAYERNHEAAVRRIGLDYGKDYGTTTHGLRHGYGQTLVRLGVPAQVIKKGLHHRHYLSQAPYVAPDRSQINATLSGAWEQLKSGRSSHVAPLGGETSRTLYRLSEFITSGGSLV